MEENKTDEGFNMFDNIDPEAFMKIMEVMETFNNEGDDKVTALLFALKPLMKKENRKAVDEAVQIARFMKIIPMLNKSGLL